ncbi:MAG: primase catalytic core domain protein [Jatrophihabitans sp.]|nr:primase catalytic core domain protein [Jatrophihabitans sp.]
MQSAVRSDADRDDPQALREVTAAAAAIFTEPPRRAAALSYLKQRGIDATGLGSEWVLGYAPPGWTRLVDRLHGSFSGQALLDAGVARRSSRGALIDAFRERVIFGLRDLDGTVAGFIARDLSGNPNTPKYFNTHQHALFDKGRLLYGLHEGLNLSTASQPVIVEGPLDVLAIAARQATEASGGLLPVASSGTAFTTAQAQRVADVATQRESSVLVAMDGDAAGRAAALNAGERLRNAGLDIRIALLANGSDPADYLARPDATLDTFHAGNGLPLLSLQVENAIARQGDAMQWPEGRLRALRSVAGHVATYPPDQAARQIGWLAEAFHMHPSTVTLELADAFALARTVGSRHAASVAAAPITM